MKVGVLALQGDFVEHAVVLRHLGVEPVEVRLPSHLEGLSGLIIPGGEVDHHREAGDALRVDRTPAPLRRRARHLGDMRRIDLPVA